MPTATEDLIAFTRLYLQALVARDTAHVRAHSIDAPGCAYVGIGSLPDERWALEELVDHLGEFPPTEFLDSNPTGCVEGGVAWLTDYPTCVLPSGERVAIRATVVLVRVREAWKVAHWHVSEGVAHEL